MRKDIIINTFGALLFVLFVINIFLTITIVDTFSIENQKELHKQVLTEFFNENEFFIVE